MFPGLPASHEASAVRLRLPDLACPAGVIHGYQNDSLGPVYFQVMLGRGKPDTLGYADDELYQCKDAHLKAV